MEEPDLASQVGRFLGRAVRKARPRAERLAASAAPRLKEATGKAAKLISEHDEELKQAAAKLVRARLTGPAGLIVDALASHPPPEPATTITNSCPQCGAVSSTSAKFCSECGHSLLPGR